MLGGITLDIQIDAGLILGQLVLLIGLVFVHRSGGCQLRNRKR